MVDVALVTDARRPFVAEAAREVARVQAALEARGWSVAVADWDGPSGLHAQQARLTVLRTPWNYYLRRPDFVRWCRSVPRLLNDAGTVQWNSHKGYLRELAARGVPVIDTQWVGQGGTTSLQHLLGERGWADAVLKPAVSAGAFRTVRFTSATVEPAQQLLATICADGDAMVQPYLPEVEREGERSLLFFGGQFSHAVRRVPPLATGQHGATTTQPLAEELALAEQVLAAVPTPGEPLLYARVDLVRDGQGRLRLMELELIEPSFFLDTAEGSAERFADAVGRRLSGPIGRMTDG